MRSSRDEKSCLNKGIHLESQRRKLSRPRQIDPARDQIFPARALSFSVFRPGGDSLHGIFLSWMSINLGVWDPDEIIAGRAHLALKPCK